jgi:hypothetical protein
MAHFCQKTAKIKGHFDVPFKGTDFNPNQALNENSQVWATATEVDATGDPISGGAHVTVQQVAPTNNNSPNLGGRRSSPYQREGDTVLRTVDVRPSPRRFGEVDRLPGLPIAVPG